MKWIVNDPLGFATSLRQYAGINLTLVNNSSVDIYYDVQAVAATLNSTPSGVVPIGTKLAASGGNVQFQNAPRELWVRAISQTVLDVQGDAEAQNEQPIKIPAGDSRGSNNVTPENLTKAKFQLGSSMRYRG